jgi:hypothetical protein
MISTSGHRGPRRRQTWSPASLVAIRAKTIPFGSAFATAQAVARARWRRCFALSLALRLLARIVLLDLTVFVTWGSDLDGIGAVLADITSIGP